MSSSASPWLGLHEARALGSRRGYLRRVAALLGRQHAIWAWIATAAMLEAAFALVAPWLASRVIDTALPNSARDLLFTLAAVGFAAAVHAAWAGWLRELTTLLLQHRLEAVCLRDTLAEYLASPYAALSQSEFGSTNETLNAASLILQTVVRSTAECVTQLASGGIALLLLAWCDPALAVMTVLLAFVVAASSAFFSVREARFSERVLNASSENQQLIHVLLRAVPTLRAAGATHRLGERWNQIVIRQASQSICKENVRLSRTALMLGGQHGVTLLATAWLAYSALDRGLSVGLLMTSTLLVGTLLRIAIGLTQTAGSFLVLRPHLARVDALLALGRTYPPPTQAVPLAADDTISLTDVWFRYADAGPWVLQGHTQVFAMGQRTALHGPSGAGKSTMLRLLAGLLPPEHGTVSVFGSDPYRTPGLVGYLPQQSILLEGSIASNLTTLSGQPLARSLEAGRLTGLFDWLATLPMGAETVVSAGGSNLSAGQRQLLLLTALFASNYPVLLLDEATSQLDTAARERIRWDELARGRTVISVQHHP
jgi:ABC-type bacteriocin/lantibiotic exporter with double-glycine peptidase domain